MTNLHYDVRVGPSNGTSTFGYSLGSQEARAGLAFVIFTAEMKAGGPDIVSDGNPESERKRRVHESLGRSISENADIWRELSKR
jgi:hypothetical protein